MYSKWLPSAKVLKLIATKEEREEILTHHLKPGKFDVCLTSYEGVNICKAELKKFAWKYIIIDEAHKIKNEESLISRVKLLMIIFMQEFERA
jgi:SWI/SNF-related matrix-associated actin-dependent regulator of chromatin subfamily A member 5